MQYTCMARCLPAQVDPLDGAQAHQCKSSLQVAWGLQPAASASGCVGLNRKILLI